MSIRQKIFLGFAAVVFVGALQGVYSIWNVGNISKLMDVVFSKPFAAVENARGAWSDFRHVQDHVTKVVSMTSPVETSDSLQAFKSRYARFSIRLIKLKGATLSDDSGRLLGKIERSAGIWKNHALTLLGAKPSESIPSPHLMHELQAEIARELDRLVDLTLSEAGTLKADIGDQIGTAELLGLIFLVCSALLGALMAVGIGLHIVRPLQRLQTTMARIAEDDLETEISDAERKDEIGAMATTLAIFRENALQRVALEASTNEDQAARSARQRKVDQLISDFRESVTIGLESVRNNTGQMEATARALTSTAEQTSQQATTAAQASDEASQNVNAVTAAAGQLASSVEEISRQVSATTDIVRQATSAAEESDTKIGGLAEAAQAIGDVLSLIRDIAEQTNLLALNATIEAARAGEAGKGFAVVAAEVKELATQTGKATEDIAAQITNIQSQTGDAVTGIRQIADIMKDVNSKTAAIASAVEQQGTSTDEISQSVQRAASGSNTVSTNISGMTSAANETSQSADKMFNASHDVTAQAEDLRGIIDQFLDEVAAA